MKQFVDAIVISALLDMNASRIIRDWKFAKLYVLMIVNVVQMNLVKKINLELLVVNVMKIYVMTPILIIVV